MAEKTRYYIRGSVNGCRWWWPRALRRMAAAQEVAFDPVQLVIERGPGSWFYRINGTATDLRFLMACAGLPEPEFPQPPPEAGKPVPVGILEACADCPRRQRSVVVRPEGEPDE